MVVWSTIEAKCPACSNGLRIREVGSGFAVGQDSDLLIQMKGKHIIQAEIHTCHRCGYSGYRDDFFTQAGKAGLLIPEHLQKYSAMNKEYKRTPLPHEQYYRTFQIRELFDEGDPIDRALLLVRAYWCLRLAPSSKLDAKELKGLENLYLKEAIKQFRKSISKRNSATLYYLLAEICRRAGNFSQSTFYFKKAMQHDLLPEYLMTASKKLLLAAQEKIDNHMSIEGVLYDTEQRKE